MQENSNRDALCAVSYMLVNALCYAVGFVLVKMMRSDGISESIIVWGYKAVLLLWLFPALLLRYGLSILHTDKLLLHLVRATFSISSSLVFYYTLNFVMVSDAAAIRHTNVIVLSIAGAIFLGEPLTKVRLFAVLASFIGVLMISYPNIFSLWAQRDAVSDISIYHGYLLLSMLLWVGSHFTAKILTKTEAPSTQLFYNTLLPVLMTTPLVINELICRDKPLEVEYTHVVIILFISSFYSLHSIALFKSFKMGDLTLVAPFQYSSIVFTTILQFLLWGTAPKAMTLLGYCFIIVPGICLLIAEQSYRKKK